MVGSYAVDPGLIAGSLQVRQKSDVELKLQILQIWDFLKLENFNPILKFTYLTASSSRFCVLAKAMYWKVADWCLTQS